MPVPLSAEPVFWFYVKEVLSKHELPRFYSLRHIASDVGRGRAWLRCALNEHSLERYLHMLLADRGRLRYRGGLPGGGSADGLESQRLSACACIPVSLLGARGFPSHSPSVVGCAGGTDGSRMSEEMNARKGLSVAPAHGEFSLSACDRGVGCGERCVLGYSLLSLAGILVWPPFRPSFFLGRNWVFGAQFRVCLNFVLGSLRFLLCF